MPEDRNKTFKEMNPSLLDPDSMAAKPRFFKPEIQQIDRRTWLTWMATGAFAIWTELAFGFGRRGWGIVLGNVDLATGLAEAQIRDPVKVLRVITEFVNSYVLVRGKEIAVVDTGLPNSGTKFGEVIKTAGLGWEAVGHVILTHYHPDHVGSIGEILSAAPKATVYAGAEDIPQIKSPRTIKPVADGDEVFGLRIIATPGHTPGHISVFDPVGLFLVVGDAMTNINNKLSGSNPQYTSNMAQANESIKKLAALKFEKAVFGHGEPIEQGASAAVAKLASTL
jgi:glyoxylase-like metal-dependent hydrolase (beta-lactamase superfamily II)